MDWWTQQKQGEYLFSRGFIRTIFTFISLDSWMFRKRMALLLLPRRAVKPPSFSNPSNVWLKGDMVSGCFRFRLKLWEGSVSGGGDNRYLAQFKWHCWRFEVVGFKLWWDETVGRIQFHPIFYWHSNTKATAGQLSWKLLVEDKMMNTTNKPMILDSYEAFDILQETRLL